MSFPFKSNYPQIARESGFRLRQFKDGPIDWRLVGSMEVDRILREQQFEHIDAILSQLSESPLSSMLDSNVLDSGVAKYFTLSQLALQYMIFCRKFLDESVSNLRDNNVKLETQNLHLRTINQEYTNDILHLHKKLSQVESINEIVFPCYICTKNFVSNDALNVHLSKKHLKIPSADIQGKDNDQTLINTIKLELEIKQLKERLNIAEKDIRQACEIKKVLPREVTNLNSSTQIDIQTRDVATQRNLNKTNKEDSLTTYDIGTQCNLFENKEFDSTEEPTDRNILNVQQNHNPIDNYATEFFFEVQEKISKLGALQESYSSSNQHTTNEIKFKLNEIKEFLEVHKMQNDDNLVAKESILLKSSLDELQTILSNMFSEVAKTNSEKIHRMIMKIEKTYEEKLSSLEIENVKKKTIQTDYKTETFASQSLINTDSIKQTENSSEEKTPSAHISRRIHSFDESNKNTSSYTRSDSSSSTNTPQGKIILKNKNVSERSKALKKLGNKMAFFGLHINSKSTSVHVATKISAHLSEQRNGIKKVYPTFWRTRNRLNKLVEMLTSESPFYQDTDKKHEQDHKENDRTKPNKKLQLTSDETNAYKKRLEKILRSPINKPTSYVLHDKKYEIKPVPMPRKHVMFETLK